MRIDDLPRLSDEDREALDDGYVAVEGVAAPAEAVPFGSGPMPLWLVATLVSATVVLILLVRYSWKLGKSERAKATLKDDPPPEQELDQEHWNWYQQYGVPPTGRTKPESK